MRSATYFALLALALVVSACGADPVTLPSPPPSEPVASAQPSVASMTLPGSDEVLPDGVASATDWQEMASHPSSFDPDAAFDTPELLADAFGAAIHADSSGGGMRPELDLVTLLEEPDQVGYLISETGVGDDSVAGTQYALLLVRESDGWRLDELQTRALCSRGGDDDLCV